jgi:hypothetical protein
VCRQKFCETHDRDPHNNKINRVCTFYIFNNKIRRKISIPCLMPLSDLSSLYSNRLVGVASWSVVTKFESMLWQVAALSLDNKNVIVKYMLFTVINFSKRVSRPNQMRDRIILTQS